MSTVQCPKCRHKIKDTGVGIYYCPKCRMQFDDDPDEGGDYGNDPRRRLMRQEETHRQDRNISRRRQQ